MRKALQPPVEHITDGREAWKLGFTGFFVRSRGIVSSLVFIFLTATGAPWWFTTQLIQIDLIYSIVYFLFILGFSTGLGFLYLRDRSIRSLQIKYYLHRLAHSIRDEQTKIIDKLNHHDNKFERLPKNELELYLKEICENLKQYFILLTNDRHIDVAIRLAVLKDKNIVCKTYARTKGLNPNREKTSEVISINEGVPKILRNYDAQGVLIYHDFIEAEKLGLYKTTKNDRKYPSEVVTAMIAPMNAWGGKKQDMIGILFITSKNRKTFSIKHVDSVAFAADVAANAISNIICLGFRKETVNQNNIKKIS